MSSNTADCLGDSLGDACLGRDASGILAAIKRGADINRRNSAGLFPVHLVVDPDNSETDQQQAMCLQVLLAHGVQLGSKHRNIYTVYERISTFLPHCALAVISHFQALPDSYEDLEDPEKRWWEQVFGQWKSARESGELEEATAEVSRVSGRSRL